MEKKKKHIQEVQSLRFVMLWGLTLFVGWGIAFFAMMNLDMDIDYDDILSNLLMIGFLGSLMGVPVGLLQTRFLHRRLHMPVRHWAKLTTFGFIGGWLIVFVIGRIEIYPIFFSPHLWFLSIFLLPAVMQWFSLRQHIRHAWLWMVANGVANFVFVTVLMSITELLGNVPIDGLLAVIAVIGGVAWASGIVPGVTLLWLTQTNRVEDHEMAIASH